MNLAKSIIIFLLLIIISVKENQAQTEKSFPNYMWIDAMAEENDGSRFGYMENSFKLIKKLCSKLPKSDPCFVDLEKSDEFTLLGYYQNSTMKDYVNILYSPGPSADPLFRISDKNNKLIWESIAEELCINDNGIIYLSGNTDKMFNKRQKLQFTNGKVKEIKQPYYYVGIKDKLLKAIKLYSEKNSNEVIASLGVGYEIEVLLAEPNKNDELEINYLVRTAFGLVGWMRLTEDDTYYMNPVIRGLGYAGD